MQKLTFTNSKGLSISFDDTKPFVFWKVDGLSLPDVTVIPTRAVGQNGYTLHDVLLDERIVKVSLTIQGGNDEEVYHYRRKITSICSPLLGLGTLVYENDNGGYMIPAFCKANPFGNQMPGVQWLEIFFECPSALWQSKELHEIGLNYIGGGLRFPLRTPTTFGKLGYRAIIENDGDGVAPLEFYIQGGSLNPKIINVTTGEFIQVTQQLHSYDKLYINTDPEVSEVSHITIDPETNQPVKSNAHGYLSDGSDLFKLVQGRNELKFFTDDNNLFVKIVIAFRKHYGGV